MTTPHDDLKKLAEEANENSPVWESICIGSGGPSRAFMDAASPARILALIDENRVLRERVERLEAAAKSLLLANTPFDAGDAVDQFYGEIEQSKYTDFYNAKHALAQVLASPEQEKP